MWCESPARQYDIIAGGFVLGFPTTLLVTQREFQIKHKLHALVHCVDYPLHAFGQFSWKGMGVILMSLPISVATAVL